MGRAQLQEWCGSAQIAETQRKNTEWRYRLTNQHEVMT